jgi:hypothetical protein
MNKIWNTLISRAALSFMSAVIFSALYNIATGHPQGDNIFLLEMFGLIVCLEIIDYALSNVPLHSRALYLCTEFAMMYVCFLIFSFSGHWFGFTPTRLILFSSIFLVLFLLLHVYDHFLLRTEANDMNNHLVKRKI